MDVTPTGQRMLEETGSIIEIVNLFAKERVRQIEDLGYTPSSDDEYTEGQLARAAACYACPMERLISHPNGDQLGHRGVWPWADEMFKRGKKTRKEELIIAGALLVAEYQRICRYEEAHSAFDVEEKKNWHNVENCRPAKVGTEVILRGTDGVKCLGAFGHHPNLGYVWSIEGGFHYLSDWPEWCEVPQ